MSANLSVAVYTSAEDTAPVLRGRGAAPGAVQDLEFSTGIPGGFLECTFRLSRPIARQWAVDTGQKVIIRRGNRIVWWGWVEDVERVLRGRVAEVQVLALGPWQQVQQRLIVSSTYGASDYTDVVLRTELAAYCDLISTDISGIEATGVAVDTYTATYKPLSDLVKTVCDAGNSEDQRMLFAIWEPQAAFDSPSSDNIIPRPTFDEADYGSYWGSSAGSWSSSAPPAGVDGSACVAANWNGSAVTWDVAYAHDNTGGTPKVIPVLASTNYRITFYTKFAAHAGDKVRIDVQWYDSSKISISTTTGTEYTATGSDTAWTARLQDVSSPAGAAYAQVRINALITASGYSVLWDNVYMFVRATAATAASKPQPYLWARDLTDYDYCLHTRLLGVQLTETTRDLANAVVASYGSGSFTAYAQDAVSQSWYRRRDAVVEAGSEASSTLAGQVRDAALAARKDPGNEAQQLTATGAGAIRDQRGRPVELWRVRAGDRLRIADGPYAGVILMLEGTRWRESELTMTPEHSVEIPALLARNL